MNIAWHNLLKDIHALRLVVILWLGWIVLQTTVLAWAPAVIGRPGLWATYQIVSLTGPMLQYLLLVILIPLVIQQDPTIETRAFWLTRPISRQTLLVSKLTFLGLIVVLPVLLSEIMVLAFNGIGGHSLLRAVPEILLIELCRLSIISVVAALTANFAHFAIAGVSYLVVTGAVGFFMSCFFVGLFHYADSAESLFSLSMMQSRDVVASSATILAGGFVLCWQYLTRKTLAAVVIAVVGALGIVTLRSAWHLDFLKGQTCLPVLNVINPDNISLSIDSVEPQALPRVGPHTFQTFHTLFHLTGMPKDRAAEVIGGNVHFKRPDGPSLDGNVTGLDKFSLPGDAPLNCPGLWVAIETDVGKCQPLNFTPSSAAGGMELKARITTYGPADYKQYVGKQVAITGEIELAFFEYKQAGATPLKTGAYLVTESSRDHVVDVSSNTSSRTILLRKQTASLLFGGEKKSDSKFSGFIDRMMPWTDLAYLLINRERSNEVVLCESILPADLLFSMTMATRMWKSKRLDYVNLMLIFPELSDEWMKEAELMYFKRSSVGSFMKSIKMKDFLMPKDDNKAKETVTPDKVNPQK